MSKIILKNGAEIEIREGCSLWDITVDVADYEELAKLSAQLTPENLKEVRFAAAMLCIPEGQDEPVQGTEVTDIYNDMAMKNPRFSVSDKPEGGLEVKFGLRELTADEMHYEEQARQITDLQMAMCDLFEA